MVKVKKTFRIDEDSYEELVKLASEWGMAQGTTVEHAIHLARQVPDKCQTAISNTNEVLDTLMAQLTIKDEQIAALSRALDAAQETAKAAQLLHAQERKALESVEQKSRWRRLREAWRG